MIEDDEYQSESEEEDDPKDPATMMKNLSITTEDVFEDETNSNAARNASANVVSQQVLFYVACCLRGHFNKLVPAAPVILVYGGGYIGQRVIDALTKAKCAEMLHVYTRGDLKAKYWRTKGLKSSPSMNRLLKGNKVDILILLAGMSSFSSMTKLLLPYISRSTCVINAAFGLERRRFFALLRTPTVFRTYLEPQSMLSLLKNNPVLSKSLKAGQLGIMARADADAGNGGIAPLSNLDNQLSALREKQKEEEQRGGGGGQRGGSKGEGEGEGEGEGGDGEEKEHAGGGDLMEESLLLDESLVASVEQEASQKQLTVLDSILTFRVELQSLLAETKEGTIEYAAELIAQRTRDLRDILFVLENYYAMLGIRHRQARTQALIAVLGYDPEEMAGLFTSASGDNNNSGGVSDSHPGDVPGVLEAPSYDSGQQNSSVLEEMLKTVKVESHDVLVAALEAAEAEVCVDFRRHFSRYIRLVDIPDPNELGNGDTRAGASKRRNRRVNPSLVGKDPARIQKVGDGDIRDDGYNDDDEEEKEHAREHGVPIHTDAKIKKILSYDMKLKAAMKEKQESLLDDFTISVRGSVADNVGSYDGDDGMSIGGDSISTLGGGVINANEQMQEAVPAPAPAPAPAPNALTQAPKMMANPLVASEEDAKLLNLLQEQAKKREALERARERRAFTGE